jgi:hypothetical protein
MSGRDGLFSDDAGVRRCAWCQSSPAYRDYHDREWGFPVDDDTRLFEKLCLEGFQAGLSWLTILNKRDAFRRAFADFDAGRVARFGAKDVGVALGLCLALRAGAGGAAEARHAGGAAGARLARRGDGAGEGPEAARLDLRRPDHGLRLHAGDGAGQRPPRRLRRSRRRTGRPRGARGGHGMTRSQPRRHDDKETA